MTNISKCSLKFKEIGDSIYDSKYTHTGFTFLSTDTVSDQASTCVTLA
jgi:hypothetical protein